MKLPTAFPDRHPRAPADSQSAFTLTEVLIAATLLVLLLGGIIGANLFGLRMSQLTQTKLKASGTARRIVGLITDEIQSCKSTGIGTVSNGVFMARLDGEPQTGSGLIIYPTTNTASYVLYFLNSADKSFRRTTSASGTTTILARGVTNQTVFRAQNYLGNTLTNNQNNRAIHFTLQFFQAQAHLPIADYYKLETSVTRRVLE